MGHEAGSSLTTGDFNIDIGNAGVAGENNTIRIGEPETQFATFIAGIAKVTIMTNAAPVAIDTNTGQLGLQAVSSRRFKDDIKPMDKTSEAILGLKPVTFHYKSDSTKTPNSV